MFRRTKMTAAMSQELIDEFARQVVLVLSATVLVLGLERTVMPESTFDHERLHVDRLSGDHVAFSFPIARRLKGVNRQARDPWLRATQSSTSTSTAMLSTSTISMSTPDSTTSRRKRKR